MIKPTAKQTARIIPNGLTGFPAGGPGGGGGGSGASGLRQVVAVGPFNSVVQVASVQR